MTRFSVDFQIDTLITEVEADTDDLAIDAAFDEWLYDARSVLAAGTFVERVIEDAA